MPTSLSKANFLRHMNNKSIELADVRANANINANTKSAVNRADLNGDGKVSGSREAERLFKNLDHFDRNGSYYSIHETSSVRALMDTAQTPSSSPSTPNSGGQIQKSDFVGQLEGKRVRLLDLRLNPDISSNIKSAAERADLNRDGEIRGDFEAGELFRQMDEFDNDGSYHSMNRTADIDRVLASATDAPPNSQPPGVGVRGDFSFRTNADALRKARSTSLGRKVTSEMPKYIETYKKASALTGVPAELIAAVHANESSFGTWRASSHGPEAGYGLDPRYVSTSWGNQHLRRHGLGSWRRGKTDDHAILQASVVAAEHLRRQAKYANVTLKPSMNQNELAAAVTSYIQGPGAGKRALRSGSSWMFKPTDANPHPYHPGGTSIGRNGETIRVPASRKTGLLRWDALLPLIQERLWQ